MSSARTIWWRALRLRCVACGRRPVLITWLREAPACPYCGFRSQREEGYWVGSYTVNLCTTLTLITVGIAGAVWWQWPTPNWSAITIGSAVACVVLPFLIFPWTKTLFLALDVIFHPPEEEDF